MKSLILYGSKEKLTNAHKPVSGLRQQPYFVRVKTVEADPLRALDLAKPVPGETVLNTVEVDE